MSRSMSWTEAGELAQGTLDMVMAKSNASERALMAVERSARYQGTGAELDCLRDATRLLIAASSPTRGR